MPLILAENKFMRHVKVGQKICYFFSSFAIMVPVWCTVAEYDVVGRILCVELAGFISSNLPRIEERLI